jgi:hypothetical protein
MNHKPKFELGSVPDRVFQNWPDFKAYINGTSASLAYDWSLHDNYYQITTEPYIGVYLLHYLENTASADLTDWVDNFRNLPLRNEGSSVLLGVTGTIDLSNPFIVTKLQDGVNSNYFAKIDSAGRISVTLSPPTAPPATTPVSVGVLTEMANTIDTDYTIGNGQILHLQRFSGGGEGGGISSVVELYYDPNGNGVDMILIRAGYVAGNNFDFALDPEALVYTGNGVRKIKIRRRRLDGGSAEIAAFWDGYLE